MFTKQNTNGLYGKKALDRMNAELAELLAENGVDRDDDTMIKHYSDKIIEHGIRKTYRFHGVFSVHGVVDIKAFHMAEAWKIFCTIDHGPGYGCSDGSDVRLVTVL